MVLWVCQWICCARRSSWSRVFTFFVIWGPLIARMGAFAIFSRFLGAPSGGTFWCMGLSSPACVWTSRKATCVPRRHTRNYKHLDDSLQPSISQPSRGINLIRLQKPFWESFANCPTKIFSFQNERSFISLSFRQTKLSIWEN